MDEKRWTHRHYVYSREPDEYKRQALAYSKEEVGKQLYGILEQCGNPVVVELTEKITRIPHGFDGYSEPMDEIEITVYLTPVKHRRVEVAALQDLSYSPPKSHQSLIKRLRYAITGEWHD